MKSIIFALSLISLPTFSSEFKGWDELEANLRASGGNTKALRHVQCFLEKGEERSFNLKRPYKDSYLNRCYKNPVQQINNHRTFAIIDYTAPSNERRMFLVDRKTGGISTMAAAHGRYKSGYFKRKLKHNHNTVKWARYYSNELGSNAPASGFYLAGQQYYGKWDRSLTLHGLEKDVNDNACERAVVIHAHKLVSKNKARVMSSGCPMVSKKNIDHVIDILKGVDGGGNSIESAGGLVFIYGDREEQWDENYCGEI